MDEINPDEDTPRTALPGFSIHYGHVPHYHGDPVRQIFVVVAIVCALALPFWTNLLPFGSVFQVVAALVLVLLAGLTNPHGKVIAVLDVVAAGAGAFLFEATAIYFYHLDTFRLFLVREIAAILFLFALYFSVKTLRAMLLGQVGKLAVPREFEKTVGK